LNWVGSDKSSKVTEEPEWAYHEKNDNSREKYTKNALVHLGGLRTQDFVCVASVSVLGAVEIVMELPQLPELENVKSCLAECEIEQCSEFNCEWDTSEDLSSN
jgi:hypothetical protein